MLKAGRTAWARGPLHRTPAPWPATTRSTTTCCAIAASFGLRVQTILLQFARGLQVLPTPKGENAVIITGAGGSGVLLSDACVDNGLSLMKMPPDMDAAFRKFIPPFGAAGNPVDITGGEPPTNLCEHDSLRARRAAHPFADSRLLAHDHHAADGLRQTLRRSCPRARDKGIRQTGRRFARRRRTGGRGERVSLRARHRGLSVHHGVAGCGARREVQMGARGGAVVACRNQKPSVNTPSVDVIPVKTSIRICDFAGHSIMVLRGTSPERVKVFCESCARDAPPRAHRQGASRASPRTRKELFINHAGSFNSAVFTIVPLAELYILIKIGSHIGGFNTILLVLMTTVLGALLARLQGLRTLRQIQLSLSQGQIPAEELIDGVLILFGGILLVIPGVLTDLFALVLLLPFTRTYFKRWLRRRFDRMMASGNVRLRASDVAEMR